MEKEPYNETILPQEGKDNIPCREIIESRLGLDYQVEMQGQLQYNLKFPYTVELGESGWRDFYEQMIRSGCKPLVRKWKGYTLLIIVKEEEEKKKINTIAGILLALTTILTLYMSGDYLKQSMLAYGYTGSVSPSLIPSLYVIGLLGPLLIHEAGHWSMMRAYKTPSSMPYLIPAPPLQWGFLGTFGAVINMRWLPPTVDALAIVGVMGPLAGFIAAIPVTIYGLKLSLVVPASLAPSGGYLTAYPIIFLLLGQEFLPNPTRGEVVLLHPLAFAGYIVFLVTFLNLIPIAQLDGGHIIRASLGEKGHRIVSNAFLILLLAFSFVETFLLLFALIAFVIHMLSRGRHPGPAMPVERLGVKGQLAVITFFILLFLTFPLPVTS
ncbi:MAG: site-2 protease family protein [Desulfurococcales archaeon]|nr:site-2 protease family protein [Desulfurococcales archaeon]